MLEWIYTKDRFPERSGIYYCETIYDKRTRYYDESLKDLWLKEVIKWLKED